MKFLLLLTILLPSFAVSINASEDEPEEAMKRIDLRWASKPLTVTMNAQQSRIANFARTFAQEYTEYTPNEKLVTYLANPAAYVPGHSHYYVEEDSRNGYLKVDLTYQMDYMTEFCYWRRPNGHSLVGIVLRVGYEGERAEGLCLFYDYNPTTGILTPDLKVKRAVDQVIARHPGNSVYVFLPQQGKDISIHFVHWDPEEDFVTIEEELKWKGNGF